MLARLAWRMPHEAAIDGCLKSGDVFKEAEREGHVLSIRRQRFEKPKISPTENYLTNRLRASDFRTAIIRITELWALQQGFPFPRPFSPSQLLIRRPSFAAVGCGGFLPSPRLLQFRRLFASCALR